MSDIQRGDLDERVVSHSLSILDSSHPRINVFIFELLDEFSMNFEIDRLSMFWVVGILNSFIGGCDLFVVGLEDRVFEEETKCGHFGDHHPSEAIDLISNVGGILMQVTDRSLVTSSMTLGGVPVRTESTRIDIIFR